FREEDFVEDFSIVSEEYPRRGWFMHEMTHVWQHQRGYAVRWHALTVTIRGESAYRYEIEPGQVFSDFNMEQQGNLVS
ncbi:PAAR domain-containing protein, partial [Burkholderia thailandensis]